MRVTRTCFDPQRVAAIVGVSMLTFGLVGFPMLSRAADGGGDAVRGKVLFEERCTGCHSLDLDKEGPRLRGVYGRKAGSVATFQYSDAMKLAHMTWDDELLNKWLTDTESVVPKNDMSFHVPNAGERADIIRFLQLSSGR